MMYSMYFAEKFFDGFNLAETKSVKRLKEVDGWASYLLNRIWKKKRSEQANG